MSDVDGAPPASGISTANADYAERLARLEGARWKRWFDVQAPYRWNVRRLCPGFTLDVGCGIGRNLAHLRGNGVGVDHNATAIAELRRRGLVGFTSEEFALSGYDVAGRFDHLLLAHVVEHCTIDEAAALIVRYRPCVRRGGSLVIITPQEAGQRSDATHVTFFDAAAIAELLRRIGLAVSGASTPRSFPLPRIAGKLFTYNELVTVAAVA
jgi:SAM-dependent methyltransferase